VKAIAARIGKSYQSVYREIARSFFTTAIKKIDEGAGHVTTLVEEVRGSRRAVTRAEQELMRPSPGVRLTPHRSRPGTRQPRLLARVLSRSRQRQEAIASINRRVARANRRQSL
jgi:hypothetical protein